jgi:hypothetical protein
MSENSKKKEILNEFSKDLLELAYNDDGKENSELSKVNTNLTIPEFEDKEAQESWDSLSKQPIESKVNSFFNTDQSDILKVHEEIKHKELNINNLNKVTYNSDENILNTSKSKPVLVKNNLPLKDKSPISDVETIAITMFQKSISENSVVFPSKITDKYLKKIDDDQQSQKINKNKNSNFQPSSILKANFGSSDNYANISENKLNYIEQIKISQNKISQLEKEIEVLKWDNEKLGSTSQLLQKKCEDLVSQKQKLEIKFENLELKYVEESKLLKAKIESKKEENRELKSKFEDLDSRLAQDIRRSGGRERDLENRLELIKLEKISLVVSKDEIILNLKRQIDQFQFEVEGYRKKNIDLEKVIESNDEQLRRTVRALRLALANLDSNEESNILKKKE